MKQTQQYAYTTGTAIDGTIPPVHCRTLAGWRNQPIPNDERGRHFQAPTETALARYGIVPVKMIEYPDDGGLRDTSVVMTEDGPEQRGTVVTAQELEAERLAILIADHATTVGALGQALAAFGLAMPIESDIAIATMYMAVKADVTLTADSQMANICYAQLQQAGVSNDDMAAVWLAIQGG